MEKLVLPKWFLLKHVEEEDGGVGDWGVLIHCLDITLYYICYFMYANYIGMSDSV